jgi:dTDP-4-dehydrorhamnose reductase
VSARAVVTVLVTGAGGQVGVDVVDSLRGLPPPGGDAAWQPDGKRVGADEFDVRAVNHHELDITRRDDVAAVLADARPDVVINLAAYTAVDRAESDAATCYLVNERATVHLSHLCAETGAHFVTISTDYVFDGLKGAAYVESDATHPLNVYGSSKRAGELGCADADTVVRTSWVCGTRGRNTVRAIAQRARAHEAMRFVTDQVGTVTAAADLARALVTIARTRPGGTWHFANDGAASWYDIACFAAQRAAGDEALVTPITTAQLTTASAARRPARSDLAVERWRSAGWRPPPPWRDALSRLLLADH